MYIIPKLKLKNDVKCIGNDLSSSILLSFVKAIWQSIHISENQVRKMKYHAQLTIRTCLKLKPPGQAF